jgi:hypothetical protein
MIPYLLGQVEEEGYIKENSSSKSTLSCFSEADQAMEKSINKVCHE